MAEIRTNTHRNENPRDASSKFLAAQLENKRAVYWDKQGHGINLCAGGNWPTEAIRNPERFIQIKNEADLDELFRHFENDE
jgi:hypothetical protein